MNKKVEAPHYDFDGSQVIDITKHLDFLTGNIVKYAARAGRKDGESALDDLLKCQYYVNKKIEVLIDERARQEALRHGLTRCDGDVCPDPHNCSGCVVIDEQPSQLQVCEGYGKPLGDCSTCLHRVNCEIRKNAQNELAGDDAIEYHTSVEFVPEAITKAGRTRKVL